MMSKLFVLATCLPLVLSTADECSNQNRDACPAGEPMGPGNQTALDAVEGAGDMAMLGTSTGWDGKGVYPNPKEAAMTVCKDADMKGTCTNAWTGITNYVGDNWNDKVSSTHVKAHYRCKFYCDSYGGAYMTTQDGPKTINWIRSWDNCISSWACERRCNKKQPNCKTHMSGCESDTYIACKECKTGYKKNSNGYCVEDPECIAIDLTIETVELDSQTTGLPDEMTLASIKTNNCQNSAEASTTVSTSKQVSHTVDTTYSLSESFSKTMGQSMSTSVTLTVKGEILPGFGADASTSISSDSSWSTKTDSSKTSTNREVNVTTSAWSHADTIKTPPYHNMTYTSIGRSVPGKIRWTGTMKCYNKLNKLKATKSVTGTYSGASIINWDTQLNSMPCGAPAGFDLELGVQCEDNMIDTGDVSYSTLLDAQNACQKLGKGCFGVMDKNCDGILDYYLCKNNGVALKASKAGTCVYKQIQDEVSSKNLAARLFTAQAKRQE